MAVGGIISGATQGRGGAALGRHLADRRQEPQNEVARLGATRKILATDIEAAIDELTLIASHARSKKTIYHVHVDPQASWTLAQYSRYWQLFEREFGLERQAFVEAVHVKHDREHYHRAYSRVREDGSVIPMSHDYPRREKIGRIVEAEFGSQHVAGGHNRAVAAALAREGREDVRQSMAESGIISQPRPIAKMTPRERHQAENSGVALADIYAVALQIWNESPDEMLAENFSAEGFRLCRGDKGPVLLDLAGGVHSLTRIIGSASHEQGRRIRAALVKARIANLDLPSLTQARRAPNDERIEAENVPDLEQEDYARTSKTGTSSGPPDNSRKAGQIRGRARPEPERRSHVAGLRKFGSHKTKNCPIDDAAAWREIQSRTNSGASRDLGSIESEYPERTGRPRRAVGRHRAADYRANSVLDAPEFTDRLDFLLIEVKRIDPMSAQRFFEERRVETMLCDGEFVPRLRMLDELVAVLIAMIAWLLRFLFGVHSDQHVSANDEEVEQEEAASQTSASRATDSNAAEAFFGGH